jgi:hypothetical protein
MRSVLRHLPALFVVLLTAVFAPCAIAQQRLNYKQEQDLKDAVYYLDQSEGLIEAIDQKSKGWQPGDSKVAITDVQTCLNTVAKVQGNLKNAGDRFARLPANPKVDPEKQRLEALTARLAEQDKRLSAITAGLEGVVNQGGTAEWKAAFDRLREINAMYADSQLFQRPDRAVMVVTMLPAAKEERARIAQKYADLMNQPTPAARDMKGVLAYFDQVLAEHEQRATAYASESGPFIKQCLTKAREMADDAVKNRKPAFFGPEGGIAQQLKWADSRLNVLTALRPQAAETRELANALKVTREQTAMLGQGLNDAIVDANRVPDDRYRGADRDALVQLVSDTWKADGLGGEPLAVGINSTGWDRDTRWEWSSTSTEWYKVDVSRIQGYVVVKRDDQTAVLHYVNIVKNHMKQDRLTAGFLETPAVANTQVQRQIKLSNVK